MSGDYELEELFEEPEELPAAAPAPAAQPASEAGGLEEFLEEVERTARYLRGIELLQRLLCPSDARCDVFVVEGDLVAVVRYYAEELGGQLPARVRELRALVRRHARLVSLVHELRSAGLLPSDVVAVSSPSLSVVHAAVFGSSAVALLNLAEPPIAVYPFGEELVELLLGEEGGVEEVRVAVGVRVGEWLVSVVRDILGGACLRHLLRSEIQNLLSVVERVAPSGGDPQP